jgi:organic radical activating enzyme
LDILDRVRELIKYDEHPQLPLIVITGGEPLRQNISELLIRFLSHGYQVEIETAGTVMPDAVATILATYATYPLRLRLICSPKTPKINEVVATFCKHYKYIVSPDDHMLQLGHPCVSTQQAGGVEAPLYFPDRNDASVTIWVQPMAVYKSRWLSGNRIPDEEKIRANLEYAASIALRWGYRLSVQLHKLVGLE